MCVVKNPCAERASKPRAPARTRVGSVDYGQARPRQRARSCSRAPLQRCSGFFARPDLLAIPLPGQYAALNVTTPNERRE